MTARMIRRREPGTIGSWPDGTPALLQRLHAARGASSLETAHPGLRHLLPPDTLSGLDDDDMAIGGHRRGKQCSRVVETG